MRRAERVLALGIFGIGVIASASGADKPAYDGADTFEPGKKYTCVPTTDHKGWDCSEAGKPVSKADSPTPTPISNPPSPSVAAPAPTPGAPAAPKTNASSNLPSYLTNAGASAPLPEQPSTVSAAAAHANVAPPATEVAKPVTPSMTKPAPLATTPTQTTPKPAPQKISAPKKPVAVASPPPTRPTAPASPSNGDFMSLPGDKFVIELAHASSSSALAAARSDIHVAHGDLYELHLRQNGADVWLLLWGSFDGVEAARNARNELARSTTAPLGWPRRIAPLQAEARHLSN